MAAIKKVETTVPMNLGALLDAGHGAVVTLVAGDTRLAAHRAVLSARSTVFAAIFNRKKQNAGSVEVRVTDLEGPVLRELLAYLYTMQAPQQPAMASKLLAAADRYGVPGLKAECEHQVASQLSVENAAAVAVLAVKHCCPNLKQAAVSFIKDNTHQVMATQGWADAMLNRAKDLVEISRLLADPALEPSRPAADTQCQPQRKDSQAPVAAASSTAPPSGGTTISQMRSLSAKEKGQRLIKAAEEGAVEELQKLLAAGADVGVKGKDDFTALHFAARDGFLEAVRSLIESGAVVNARDHWQYTPLHWAALNDHADVVRLLVESSADIEARDMYGGTPLHSAAYVGQEEVVAALLEAGADRGAKDDGGSTPLDVAMNSANKEVVEMLFCYSEDFS